MELSSPDIRILIDELQYLVGGKIQKIYHERKDIHMNIYVSGMGTKTIVLGQGKFFVTSYSLKHRDSPTSFCMFLRKRLKSVRISSIEQVGFERIIILKTDIYNIIFELFSKGNVIVTDKDNKIISLIESRDWNYRVLKRNEIYVAPPEVIDVLNLDKGGLEALFKKTDKKLVPFIAREMGFGGKYAEELAFLSNIKKDELCKTLDKKQITSLYNSIESLLDTTKKTPFIVLEDKKKIDVSYVNIHKYADYDKINTKTFNDAVDDAFVSVMAIELASVDTKVIDKKISSLQKRLDIQEKSFQHLEELIIQNLKKGDMIYEYFQGIDRLINLVMAEVNISGWNDIEKRIKFEDKDIVLGSIDTKDKIAKIIIAKYKINILLEEAISKSAEAYYAKSKSQKSKLQGLRLAIANTMRLMQQKDDVVIVKKQIIKKKDTSSQKWFEKFRNFESSEGFLCVGGRDATSNEIVVKKHAEKDDMIFHADIAGSPFIVVKTEGKTVGDATIEEAAQFTAMYSKAWKANAGVIDVYWVKPEQVTKQAPSGEYISKGGFMIHGKKNNLTSELKVAVCMVDGEIISGPINAIKKKTNKYIVIIPGYTKSKDLSKIMKTKLFEKSNKGEQDLLRKIPIDKFQRCIPSDRGELELN
ncbi:MAG: NFACT family protein [DPANN group archaeon]|nr:NFACT family protein [DPANN group archaeon]